MAIITEELYLALRPVQASLHVNRMIELDCTGIRVTGPKSGKFGVIRGEAEDSVGIESSAVDVGLKIGVTLHAAFIRGCCQTQ
jgi:hypothetical protein